jgi:cell division protein ZapA
MSQHPDQARVNVRILEKEYAMSCPYEERSALLDSAEYLNARMREVRDSGKVVGVDRIAVMVALNLVNELLRAKNHQVKLEGEVGGKLRHLRERVESSLVKNQQLEF